MLGNSPSEVKVRWVRTSEEERTPWGTLAGSWFKCGYVFVNCCPTTDRRFTGVLLMMTKTVTCMPTSLSGLFGLILKQSHTLHMCLTGRQHDLLVLLWC